VVMKERRMKLVPMVRDVFERPEQRRDRLVAHLLRYRDAVGFPRRDQYDPIQRPDPELAAILQHDIFNLAARRAADRPRSDQ